MGGSSHATDSPAEAPRRLARQGVIYTLGTAAPAIATLVVLPLLTRTLPRAEYDTVAVALAVIQVGVVLAALGLGAAITREYVLNPAGAPGAQGLVIAAAGISVGLCTVGFFTGPLWSPAFLGRPFDRPLAIALACCVGGALVIVAQSYLRGADRPVVFVCLALGGTLVGPALGIVVVTSTSATATAYLGCLAIGYLLAGLAGVVIVVLDGRPLLRWSQVRAALRIGVPTVPHQIALYLAVSGLIIIADRVLSQGGRANIVLTLGASTTVITGAFNNAWAPTIYRAAPASRTTLLSTTSRQVYSVVAVLVVSLVAAAPYALAIVAPPEYRPGQLLVPIAIVALAALPSVVYLASGHLVFVSGRTVPLSISTPLSVGAGLGFAVLASDRWGLVGVACAYLVTYVLLAVLTTVVQRNVAATPWWPAIPLLPTLLCLAAVAFLVVTGSSGLWIAVRGAVSAGAIALCWHAVRRRRPREPVAAGSGRTDR